MTIFLTLLVKLIPLYLMILLGFIASKKLNAKKETIGSLLIYTITPVVMFYGAYTVELTLTTLLLPGFFFIIASTIGIGFYLLSKKFYSDSTPNIMAMAAGTGNTGYFGLPVVLVLFGETGFALATVSIIGFIVFENTIGVYLAARGHHSVRDSLYKVLTLPVLYAFTLGLLLNWLNIPLNEVVETTVLSFRGAYTVLGMMLIGMGLSGIHWKHIDWKFIGLTHIAKFVAWPAVILGIIYLDAGTIALLSKEVTSMMILMAIVPLAANTIAFATELKVHPEKMALAVLSSTIFAMGFIPFMVAIFI